MKSAFMAEEKLWDSFKQVLSRIQRELKERKILKYLTVSLQQAYKADNLKQRWLLC